MLKANDEGVHDRSELNPGVLPDLKRSAGIFADCQVRHVLAVPGIATELFRELSSEHPVTPTGSMASCEFASAMGPCAEESPDTAYILYTSGSTGKPKGVIPSHDSAVAFIDWCSTTFSPPPHRARRIASVLR